MCHDVRKFSSCFIFPGCSDQQAAHVSVKFLYKLSRTISDSIRTVPHGVWKKITHERFSRLPWVRQRSEDFMKKKMYSIVHVFPTATLYLSNRVLRGAYRKSGFEFKIYFRCFPVRSQKILCLSFYLHFFAEIRSLCNFLI